MRSVTCTAPVNIAVIKYWGKRDEDLILPTNDSLSVTLQDLYSTTKITSNSTDQIFLNGKKEQLNKRLVNVLTAIRKLANNSEPVLITSENNFPTAAGLASSASGYACLAYSLARFYNLDITMTELSKIARIGSGSACRSLFGGYVAWQSGTNVDGSDSMAVQIAPQSHWPEMQALICVVSDAKKHTSSTSGMQTTILTSDLVKERIGHSVPLRMEAMKRAILSRNFVDFAEITMKDSNQFHAVCLDTFPPIFYLTDVSRRIIMLVHTYNADGVKLAYTFDAGPNAVIYGMDEDLAAFRVVVENEFSKTEVVRIFHTRVGSGPALVHSDI